MTKADDNSPELLLVGTHRRAHRDDPDDLAFGIYSWVRGEDGAFAAASLTETPQPGWITLHPNRRFVYAANEVRQFEGRDGGAISAFAIAADGTTLVPLNVRPIPAMPCHCEVDASGRYLLVATFAGGSVHMFALDADGSIGPECSTHHHQGSSIHPRRQTSPHAHAVAIDPGNRFVLVPDLGTDSLLIYGLDLDAGRLVPHPERTIRLPAGSGPRHVAFSPDASHVYLMNEMNASITAFDYDAEAGTLSRQETTELLPEGFAGLKSGGAIEVHHSGRFVYATTRSHGSSGEPPARGLDTLVWLGRNARDGSLTLLGRTNSGGQIPRSFAFDGSGERLFIGHQCSGTIVAFDVDPVDGTPAASGETIKTPVPTCVSFTKMT